MWRWLLKPEMLFLFGTVQALMPYWMWARSPNVSYYYAVTYIPAVFWVAGYVAFWCGAKLAGRRRRPPSAHQLVGRAQRIATLTKLLIVALIVQCVALTAVYGAIPILSFFTGGAESVNVDLAARQRSFIGQLALFLTSQFLLDALIVLLIATAAVTKRRHRLLLISALAMVFVAGVFAGKRQPIVIAAVMLAVASTLVFGHPAKPILKYLGFRRLQGKATLLMIAVPAALVVFLGVVATLRTGMATSGLDQVTLYLEIPLINTEVQTAEVGYGPREYKPLGLLQYVVPDRLAARFEWLRHAPPPRAELSAPAGFYGDLHWLVGLPGALLFSCMVGFIAKYFYLRAAASMFHLLVYSLMTWTLITPFLYNHFLHANFLLYPSIAFALLLRLAGLRRAPRRRHVGAVARRAEIPVLPAAPVV